MTLNLSKSFKPALLALIAIFLAAAEVSHFLFSSNFSACFLLTQISHQWKNLLDGTGSGALENTWDSERGEVESLDGIEDSGEVGGGTINQNSSAVSNISNHNDLAMVLSEVHISNSTWLNEVSEYLQHHL